MTTLIAGSEGEGANNTAKLTAAFEGNETLDIPPMGAMPYYFYGTAVDNGRIGAGQLWSTKGCMGYPVYGHPTLTGQLTRFIQTRYGYPFLRCRGAGFETLGSFELMGDGISPAIEVEGRNNPSTGHHSFRGIQFINWGYCFDVLAGYYDESNVFVSDESHAENTEVYHCRSYDCGTFYRSKNQQALNWYFNRCSVWNLGVPPVSAKYTHTIFDIERGGWLQAHQFTISHPRATLLRVRDYSPNQSYFKMTGLTLDRSIEDPFYLELTKFDGSYMGSWYIEIEGHGATYQSAFNPARLYNVPSKLPRKFFNVKFGYAK